MRLRNKFGSFAKLVSSSLLVSSLVVAAVHAGDASGSWTWIVKGRQGAPDRKIELKLKVAGDKVTGTIIAPGRNGDLKPNDISEGTIKGNEISFQSTRLVNGTPATTKYKGMLSGDTITGQMEFERNGEPVHRDWIAKRK